MLAAVISGNLVTITIFLKRQLRKRAYFLLISLVVTDLLVGLVTIPLYIALQYVHVYDNFEDEIIIVAVTDFMDMFTGFTYIFTRATIALERMYAVGWSFRHRTHSSQFSIFVISVPWILSLVAASTKIVLQYVLVRPLTFMDPIVGCCINKDCFAVRAGETTDFYLHFHCQHVYTNHNHLHGLLFSLE